LKVRAPPTDDNLGRFIFILKLVAEITPFVLLLVMTVDEVRQQHHVGEIESPVRLPVSGRRGSRRVAAGRRVRQEELDIRRAILDSLGVPRDLNQVCSRLNSFTYYCCHNDHSE